MTWADVITILNALINQSNSTSQAIAGAIVNGRINYEAIDNKPTINGVTLVGAQTSESLDIEASGGDESTVLDRAEAVATDVANQAVATKADAATVEAMKTTLASKLTSLKTNVRGVFASVADAQTLMDIISESWEQQQDATVEGSQILVLANDTANYVSIYTFSTASAQWNSSDIPLNVNGGGVQEVTVRATVGEEVGTQIAAITVDGVTTNIYCPPGAEGTVPIDITLSSDPSDTRVPSSRCVKLALDEKADLDAFNELLATVATKANASDLASTNNALEALETAVNAKADSSALETLAETVSGHSQDISDINTALDEKATTSQLSQLGSELEDAIAAKASASDVYTKAQTDTALAEKVDVDQGTANAGKVMTVGADGNLTPAEPSADGNTINVGAPASGYYTLATAVDAVPQSKRKAGLCVTFKIANNEWDTQQFVGEDIANWADTTLWSQVAAQRVEVDAALDSSSSNPVQNAAVTQRILALEQNAVTQIDNSLDTSSTNPVQNAAVATAIEALQNPTFNADVDEVADGQQVTLTTQTGQQVAQFVVQGGAGGESSASKISLSGSASPTKVKVGGSSTLSWTYQHLNSDNISDGIAGDVTITVKRGAVTLHEETLSNVSPSDVAHTIDLSAWLTTAGTIGITIRATAVDGDVQQSKQTYVAITVVSLSLSLNNASALINKALSGGYADGETITIGYTLVGSGTKNVNMYLDNNETPTVTSVTKSGTTNGQFTIDASTLTAGRHVIQLVADNDDLLSESTYIDILKAGSEAPFIGLYFVRDDGVVFPGAAYTSPVVAASQYATTTFYYFVYDPDTTTATVTEYRNGTLNHTFTVGRSRQTFSNRYLEAGTYTEQYVCGATTYNFSVLVSASSVDVSEATLGLAAKLSANGRSNGEANPAQWVSGDVSTQFYGFDWNTSGWNGDALVLMNGARIVIGAYPFYPADAASTGKTIEMEFKISNVIDNDAAIISCYEAATGKGFRITGSEASLLTGSSVTYTDENDEQQTRVVGVKKTIATDMDLRLVFVIGLRGTRLMELYVNGVREKADIYNTTDNFAMDSAVGITFDSAAADIELRNVNIYDRPLDDDELVDNFIVNRKTVSEMLSKYEENDVLEDDRYDITKIRAKGKGVVHFMRDGGLDPVNATNNKKTDFVTDFEYYSPFGPEWDLKVVGCNMRIQGTSSTKYPRKNYRIYLLKPDTAVVYRRNATTGAWEQDADFSGYIFRTGGREAPLICLKADYSDSSMTANTGGAKMFDHLMRELELVTPPQEVDSGVRQAIDGFPVDVFVTNTNAQAADTTVYYYGQYNFNHDKGKSKNLFGHVNMTDDENVTHSFKDSIALEGLNNSKELCLFQGAGSANSTELEAQLTADFDGSWEFNHPEDTVWDVSDVDNAATADQRTAIHRLFGWVHDCVAATVGVTGGTMAMNNLDYGDSNGWSGKSKWVCTKFQNELSDYFNVQHLCTYYVFTDYCMSVDQRAKNTIIRTWDLLHWFITYYDGDTQWGKRNDSFLVYLYTLSRDTWDSDKSKFAYEGHNSWLWCLLLANFEEELRTAAKNMRNILTNDYVLNMLNVEQQGNWCERAYNKSGEFKYIIPTTEGVVVGEETKVYPFIYALDGTNFSHRVYTILHRFALLDAKYGCDAYKDDNLELYLSRAASDAAGTVQVTSNAPYYFDWNTKNGGHSDPQQADEGDTVTLTFTGAITVNDPVDIYGASCMEKLNISGIGASLQNGLNLNKAKLLREIDASSVVQRTQSWFFNFESCTRLRKIDCTNQFGVKTGTASSTEFNVSNQTRLEELDLSGTGVLSVEIAEGAPITHLELPKTLQVLKLRYLASLASTGLSIEDDDYSAITTLNFSNCPLLDWTAIAALCPNLDRLRVEGLDIEDDGTILGTYQHYRGIDAEGNAVATCQLVGTVHLTRYLDEATYADYVASYPSLNIVQPEYTMIEFDDSVSDDANVSNLDNRSGYKYDNDYTPSGHILKILNNRHRVLSKNTADGVCTIFPLHDSNSAKFADSDDLDLCSEATLTGAQGDVMMYEPGRWYKGVNDFLNKKHYSCYSSADANHMPSTPTATVLTYADLEAEDLIRVSYAILTGKASLSESYSGNSSYSVVHVHVSGYSRVRFPTVPGSNFIGSIFTDGAGNIIDSVMVETLSGGFESGMYVISNVPSGATDLYFTILKSAEFDKVVLSNSTNIEDMEPDWVWAPPCLVGVAESMVVNDKLRSVMTSAASAGSLAYSDFSYYSGQRGTGFQQIDYEASKDIANLFYAKYGRRDSQGQCGAGSSSAGRSMNGTISLGMKDTINPDGASEGAWYLNSNGDAVSIANNNVLGYQDLQGDKAEWMDNVTVNQGSVTGKWSIVMPDGTTRLVKGSTSSGYIKGIVHGKYMDIISAGSIFGSSSSYYCDFFGYSGSTGRVVYRSDGSAYANGGVACAGATGAPSSSFASIGSRLAFRGTIVTAASVTAFLALTEIS